ncbi:translation initiation factor IF-3 [Entomoplasma freundtii]|uniref:Translation initiation factor IF-3 n=1 Tax=Entomoplasma freundtii TaxID=74700 RepID=A0A2K8NR05_9MOLU|nr:translation initiation factor IF-3 [Entomoplasma freundtii]ATZ16285.1 translation initiation factor IF-3 [Entomoplasma freundtii]TDY56813.1 translation initiation factor IF-3 [Entomoplasma freundtii]
MDQNNQSRNQRFARNHHQDPINGYIRARQILVIDQFGNKRGVLSKGEAIGLAERAGLDLMQVGTQPDGTAIAKIVDYGKYKYEQQKKQKEAKKNQVKTENKEIRLTVNIGEHDLDTKARKAREFLEEGNRVKISLKFRGREITYLDLGKATLERFYKKIEDIAKIEKEAKLNTRFLDMYVVPKKN